jgi:spermidine synthase
VLAPAAVGICVCLLFAVSGSVGLIYEVAWKHIFTTVFGSTTYAVSVVISVFMAGLALGSFVFGKLADRTRRHLLVFALLQVGVAVSGILVPHALRGVEGLYQVVFRTFESPALLITVQVLVSAVILLVPTFLMGGTLPILSRFMATRRGQVGSAVGLLYGLNTRS